MIAKQGPQDIRHSFAYDGACEACAELIAGCRFCPAPVFGQLAGCKCPLEPIHIARALHWRQHVERKRRAARASPVIALEPPAPAYTSPEQEP